MLLTTLDTNRFPLQDWLAERFALSDAASGKEVHFDCPQCGDARGRFYVNLKKQLGCCHNCGWSPHLIEIIAMIEGVGWEEAQRIVVRETYGAASLSVEKRMEQVFNSSGFLEEVLTLKAHSEISLPPMCAPLSDLSNDLVAPHRAYMLRRNFGPEYWGLYRLYGCFGGKFKGRVIFPQFENGRLVGYQGRAIGESCLKMKTPLGVFTSEWLFNLDTARNFQEIWIAEGPTSAMRVGPDCVGSYTKHLSDYQVLLLKETGVSRVGLIYDPDANKPDPIYRKGVLHGYQKYSAVQKATYKLQQYFTVRVARLVSGTGPGGSDMDPGDYDPAAMPAIKQNATMLNSVGDVQQMIAQL